MVKDLQDKLFRRVKRYLNRESVPEGTQQTLKEIRTTLKIINFITKGRVGEVGMQIIEDVELMKNLFIMLDQAHTDQ
jgi:hypothetical protein